MDKGSSSSNGFKRIKSLTTSAFNNSTDLVLTFRNDEDTTRSLVSPEILKHSNIGEYVRDGKRHYKGGHGQDSLNYMKQNKIKYEITIEYNNGVRVGNIPESKQRTARSGNNHSWFPKEWNKDMIDAAAKFVAKNIKNPIDGHQYSKMYKNVMVTVIFNNKKIYSVFPNKKQPGGIKKWLKNKWNC